MSNDDSQVWQIIQSILTGLLPSANEPQPSMTIKRDKWPHERLGRQLPASFSNRIDTVTVEQDFLSVFEPCNAIKDDKKRVQNLSYSYIHGGINRDYNEYFETVIKSGFQRSDVRQIFTQACTNCNACQPVRVNVEKFDLSRSRGLKRCFDTNSKRLFTEDVSDFSYMQHGFLNHHYMAAKHPLGVRSIKTSLFSSYYMPLKTHEGGLHMTEFRVPLSTAPDRPGALVGAQWRFHTQNSGISIANQYFDPTDKTGLGNFMILHAIEQARKNGIEHVYLGSWTREDSKYSYKSRFANEILEDGEWRPLEKPALSQ